MGKKPTTEAERLRKNEYLRQWRASRPEAMRAERRRYYVADVQKARDRAKRYRTSNLEKVKAALAEWRAANKDRERETNKAWRAANPDKVAAWAQQRNASGRGSAATAKWLAAHPEYSRDASRTRRARKRTGLVKRYKRLDIFERDRWVCQLCHKKVKKGLIWPDPGFASIDHIIPLALGGTEEPANVQLAHLRCNLSKRTRAMGEQTRLL